MGAAVLLASLYVVWLGLFPTLTGSSRLDGSVGVLLGLYVCSRPAGHLVDLLFFHAQVTDWFPTRLRLAGWIALNALVMLVGWFVILIGTTRFTL